jgi:hypothetical protein
MSPSARRLRTLGLLAVSALACDPRLPLASRPGSGAALAQAAESALDNLSFTMGPVVYRIPRLIVRGSPLSQSDLAALLDANSSEPLQARVARLSAREIVVPQLVAEQALGASRQVTTYRDIVLSDVTQGRVASAASTGGTFETTGAGPLSSGGFGRIAAGEIDMAGAVALYSERAGTPPPPYRKLYGSFSLDTLTANDADGTQVRVGRLSATDFQARPTPASWGETIKALGALPSEPKPSGAEMAKSLAASADLIDAFRIGTMEAVDVQVSSPKSRDAPNVRIARIAYAGAIEGGRPAEMRLDGMDVTSKDGSARIASIALAGFSLEPTVAGMRSLAGRGLEELDPAEFRKLMPVIGTLRLSGLSFDIPDEGKSASRIRFSIGGVEMTADRLLNGVPTNIAAAVDSLSLPIQPGTKQEGLRELAEMGYQTLDLSAKVAATWHEAANEIRISEASLRGMEMGSIVLRGVLGGVTRDLFSPDSAVAAVALVGATAQRLDLVLQNNGLFDKLTVWQSKAQKKSPEDLRREYGMMASLGISSVLGNSAQAKAVAQAVARFVAKPNRLTLSARTRDPAGLGISDLAGLSEPAALLDKLEVTAAAE